MKPLVLYGGRWLYLVGVLLSMAFVKAGPLGGRHGVARGSLWSATGPTAGFFLAVGCSLVLYGLVQCLCYSIPYGRASRSHVSIRSFWPLIESPRPKNTWPHRSIRAPASAYAKDLWCTTFGDNNLLPETGPHKRGSTVKTVAFANKG